MEEVLHGPRRMPHFPVMCLPHSMENQPESRLCRLGFDVDDRCAHNFSLLPKHCCPFPTPIQHHQTAALPDPPFTPPSYIFWAISPASGGSKHSCVSKRRPSCCLQAPAFQSPNPNRFAVTWRSGMSVYGLLLGFFPPLFIHICRIEFMEQNHSFSLFWCTGGNGGTGGLWGRVGVFFTAAARSVLLFHLKHHHEIIKCAFWKNRVQPSPWRQLINADLPFSAALTKKNLNEVKWW